MRLEGVRHESFDLPASDEQIQEFQHEVNDRMEDLAVWELIRDAYFSKDKSDSVETREKIEKVESDLAQAQRTFLTKFRLIFAAFLAMTGTPNTDSTEIERVVSSDAFSERNLAAEELDQNGITQYQRQAYKGALSDALSRGVYPYGYGDVLSQTVGAASGVVIGSFYDANAHRHIGHKMDAWAREQKEPLSDSLSAIRRLDRRLDGRLDAWRMYLGIPQTKGTFGISEFKPAHSHDDRYYYRLERFIEDFTEVVNVDPNAKDKRPVAVILTFLGERQSALNEDTFSGVMGGYIISKGEDERGHYISYWDRWDLDGSLVEGKEGRVGKPFEIYDRVYYDPKTLEFIPGQRKRPASEPLPHSPESES